MLSQQDKDLRDLCVEHWFENLMLLDLNYFDEDNDLSLWTDISTRGSDCAFCQQYFTAGSYCQDCPIQKTTHEICCDGTPYEVVSRIYGKETYNSIRKAFIAEINFLLSL